MADERESGGLGGNGSFAATPPAGADAAPTPAEFVDLTAPATRQRPADRLVVEALTASQVERFRPRFEAAFEDPQPGVRALAAAALSALADLATEMELSRQEMERRWRTKAERIRIDPLPMIPEDRRTPPPEEARPAPPPPPSRLVLRADAAGLIGFGWFPAETDGSVAWRWSGPTPCASLLLPSLGGGRLRLTLTLRSPFGHPCDGEGIMVFANAAPAELWQEDGHGGTRARFAADLELEPDAGDGRLAVVLHIPVFRDPQGMDTRVLGYGLEEVVLERLDAPPA